MTAPRAPVAIRLHQFAPAFGLPNASPFCMKLETWLRMAGLPFELVNDGDVFRAPKGKMPWIEDGELRLGDSGLVIEHLRLAYAVGLDEGLTPLQQAQATALQRLFEDSLYWCLVHARWIDPAGWPQTRRAFFGALPPPLRWLLPPLARRGIRAQLRGHGMGRHTPAEIRSIGMRDLDAVSVFLADKPFMLGDTPSTLDATAFAFLANVLGTPWDMPLRRHAQGLPNLAAYCQRMQARCYPTA